jgi:ribosomal protein S12 methylthiotransferase accessory factor
MAGTACWVPYELVHTDATVPWMPGSGAFLASTNGLASGNTRAEAVLHGLCEIIERDAMALWEYSGEENQGLTRMDLAAAADPDVQELLERYARAGISVMAWNATSDIGLAVVRCVIFDLSSDPVFRPIPAAFGAGCHPDPNVALLRAMTEAAQSRLTVIAGSRDDFGRLRYRSTQSQEALEYHRWLAQTRPGTVPVDSLPLRTGATVDDDLRNVIELLRRVGAPQVLVIDLGQAELPVSVVRVIVPVLEGPTESSAYLPGPRVRSLLQRLKTS